MLHLLSIDPSAVDWARAQFALTAIYHWLFVPLTLGLGLIMSIMETKYYRTGDQFWRKTAQFWQRLFGINFAMGVATGIILEFEFGTNWSNYSWFVGDIFGAPLAIEGIVAFFMESTFVAVMYFGWEKVSKGFHLASTWLTWLGATISAWWILVANSWMQYPVGCEFNPDTMRNEMTSFLDVALSPFAVSKFCHTVTSSWIVGAVFCVAVCCWYLLKKRETKMALESMKIGAAAGLIATVLAAVTGHKSAQDVAAVQPMKLAAMEALYDGGTGQGLKLIEGVEVPYALSFMATNDFNGYVPGINDILNGYTLPDGTRQPSADEKIERGKKAIAALAVYRQAKADGADEATLSNQLSILNENMPYFGYGYIRDKEELVPPIAVNFWAFRVMVGLGCLFILFFVVVLAGVYKFPKKWWQKYDITALPSWHYWLAVVLVPLAYVASESGWLVAEFGRQPWTIQDMLPVSASVSDIGSSAVALTFWLFLILFTLMLSVEINIMLKQIKKGSAL
jgi:cytochrome d ubiquinol oxidase subunit I